jgi:predicted transcriptional regulator of viral defense system
MSTLKSNITASRIALLAKKGEKVFHTDDLANLWDIQNKNTLRVTLKRYVENGLFYRIYKGFYSLVSIDELDPVLIGAKAIHQFCYLSTETVLRQEGYILQNIGYHTFVGQKGLKFVIGGHKFKSRQLDEKYLYNPEGVLLKDGVKIAAVPRAICDMLYFNPNYHFDRPIDWRKIRFMQKKIGYPLTPRRYDPA